MSTDDANPLPTQPGPTQPTATYAQVKSEIERLALTDDYDLRRVLVACHEAWENFHHFNNDPEKASEASWCYILEQEFNNKYAFESLLVATLLFSRKDMASKKMLGKPVLDVCVRAIGQYKDDEIIVVLAAQVINNTSRSEIHM